MIIQKNLVLKRSNKKPIVWDVFYNASEEKKPLILFCHGYKGFKDWGAWNAMATRFAASNFMFVKFNFSHNGGTVEQPIDFPDLEAFAENNYSKELEDLDDILNHLLSIGSGVSAQIDTKSISLLGHSRGGGIAIIKASEDTRITHLATLASVSNYGVRTSTTGDLEQWKKDGVKYVLNGRTKQMMPHNYQFYLDFIANKSRLNIKSASQRIAIPFLIIHGTKDTSIPFTDAEEIKSWNPSSILNPILEANHVFNTSHPWHQDGVSNALDQVINTVIKFLRKELYL